MTLSSSAEPTGPSSSGVARTRWRRISRSQSHSALVTWVEFDWDDHLIASSASDGSVMLHDAMDGNVRQGPIEFDTSGTVASYFHYETGDVVTLDSTGQSWTWPPRSGGGLTTRVGATSGGRPAETQPEWIGVSDGRAVAVSGSELRDLGADAGAIDAVMGRSGAYAVVYPDQVDWFRADGNLVRSIETPSRSIDGRIAVSDDVLALALPSQITVFDAQGATIEEVGTTTMGPVTRLDLSDSGRDLIFSNFSGTLFRFSLGTPDSEILLPDGTGHDAHFLTDGRIVAVGSQGVQLLRLDSDDAPTTIGIGRDATALAFDDDRALAATMTEAGILTLWNTDVGEQIGRSFVPLEGEVPVSIGFSGNGQLIVGAESSSVIIPTDPDDWITRACTLIEWLSPDHPLPQRLQTFEEGCA